jgi:hypothetical protein
MQLQCELRCEYTVTKQLETGGDVSTESYAWVDTSVYTLQSAMPINSISVWCVSFSTPGYRNESADAFTEIFKLTTFCI